MHRRLHICTRVLASADNRLKAVERRENIGQHSWLPPGMKINSFFAVERSGRFNWIHQIVRRMSSHIRGCGRVCEGIKQTLICKRLLFWPGFQIGYQGLLSVSSASQFTVCKSSIWICELRLSLFCYFCSQIQNCNERVNSQFFFLFFWVPHTECMFAHGCQTN